MLTIAARNHTDRLAAAMGNPDDGSYSQAYYTIAELLNANRNHIAAAYANRRTAAAGAGNKDLLRTYIFIDTIVEELRRRADANPELAQFHVQAASAQRDLVCRCVNHCGC